MFTKIEHPVLLPSVSQQPKTIHKNLPCNPMAKAPNGENKEFNLFSLYISVHLKIVISSLKWTSKSLLMACIVCLHHFYHFCCCCFGQLSFYLFAIVSQYLEAL